MSQYSIYIAVYSLLPYCFHFVCLVPPFVVYLCCYCLRVAFVFHVNLMMALLPLSLDIIIIIIIIIIKPLSLTPSVYGTL
jgi:hypothetical protein